MKIPTDIKLLKVIHNLYYEDYKDFSKDKRETKIYVPIDCKLVANKLGVDGDIVFGRLYYHLDKKFGYQVSDNSRVHFFSPMVGKDRHCINFPLLSSVLAGLKERKKEFWTSTIIAGIALVISIIALFT